MPADPHFLGTGWSFPPRFAPDGSDVELVAGPDDVHQSLEILLGTIPGERVFAEDFGCDLSSLVFLEVNQSLITNLRGMISDAILIHEPRIQLNALDVAISSEVEGLLLIHLTYTIRAANSRYNMVYPFYQKEATRAGG